MIVRDIRQDRRPAIEQAKAYSAMLTSKESLKGEVPPASIFDLSLAEAAKE
jgi:hypothetical protein